MKKRYSLKKTAFGWGVKDNKTGQLIHSWSGAEAKKNAEIRRNQLNEDTQP